MDNAGSGKAMTRESEMVAIERDANGKPTIWCDPEIVDLVTALNAGGLATVASCSGHGFRPGFIALADGRWLFVATDQERHAIDAAFPLDINGEPTPAASTITTLTAERDALAKATEMLNSTIDRCRKDATTAEALVQSMREALENIRELNFSGADENGKQWANSDLIDQEITAALSRSEV